jgi:hypothetical protein
MKNIFTLLLAIFFTATAFAYDGGKLTITVASAKNVQVYVDGRLYQEKDNSYVLNNLQPGNHNIKVYKRRNNDNNGRNNGRRDNRNDQRDLLYNSNVYVRNSYHVDVMINRFGKALVDERQINGRYDDDDWYDNGNDDNDRYHQAMSDRDFNQLLQKIRNQWFGKLSTAKDGINANYFTTYQVKQILQIFSSEADKLELAKLSYKNIVDRQNFKDLYDLFSRQSRNELDNYTRDFRY